MRALLSKIIGSAPDLKVVGEAANTIIAFEMFKSFNPDVLILDVEMPRMVGLDFLKQMMKFQPMPVIIIASLTERGSEAAMQGLELGAVDFLAKPHMDQSGRIEKYAEELFEKIRGAAGALPKTVIEAPLAKKTPFASLTPHTLREKLIAIGASTGGTEAIKDVLAGLPEQIPGIVITQHIPEMFTASFAKRLESLSCLRVIEAQGGEKIEPGHAYLAPGHSHLLIKKSGGDYFTQLSQAAPVNRHRPSVDVMFRSVAATLKHNAIGVILTGMGKDGAQGMLEMRKAGAWTIGQDQKTCVVYGMPREAALLGAIDEVAPLPNVAELIMTRLRALERQD